MKLLSLMLNVFRKKTVNFPFGADRVPFSKFYRLSRFQNTTDDYVTNNHVVIHIASCITDFYISFQPKSTLITNSPIHFWKQTPPMIICFMPNIVSKNYLVMFVNINLTGNSTLPVFKILAYSFCYCLALKAYFSLFC